ncbi:hypothetical protein N7E02_07650 (plasmid) [Aliirhizobium terrae]|uniref:hypothetical protein n=1 Tax=Terrirhizobium terrae TaxID=2926709 RepID=UPI002577F08A|nr:hypothetical protein [Rhizobium sp. CC-CFT758]WJH38480.1 hypothetical protein N7E02_07650 [Rhizobium sp. CC-CFT758]
MIEANLPDDFYSVLITGAVILAVLWVVVFIIRKLVGGALIAALVVGGWFVWHDPSILRTAGDTVLEHVGQWRQVKAPSSEMPRG